METARSKRKRVAATANDARHKRPSAPQSSATLKAPPRGNPDALVPVASSVRLLLRRVHALLPVLQGEMWLLSQIHYRDHGSMRTSKFYQSAEGMLRALRRLLGDVHPSPAAIKRARHESRRLPVSSRIRRGGKARFPPIASALMSDPSPLPPLGPCALRDALRHGTRALVSMYPPGKKRGTNPLVPPKLSGVPNAPPPVQATRSACTSILQSSVQLVALLDRCQSAYRTLSLHLRTRPAPTFVPSVLSMLAIIARIHMAAREVLLGKAQPVPVVGGAPNHGLLELYALLVPFTGKTGAPLDLYALVCAMRGEATLAPQEVDHVRPLLSNEGGDLPSSIRLETHGLSVGGVSWLSDLRIPPEANPPSPPPALSSKPTGPTPSPVPALPGDPMLLDDDLGEVVDG